jgi:hypothetical protein
MRLVIRTKFPVNETPLWTTCITPFVFQRLSFNIFNTCVMSLMNFDVILLFLSGTLTLSLDLVMKFPTSVKVIWSRSRFSCRGPLDRSTNDLVRGKQREKIHHPMKRIRHQQRITASQYTTLEAMKQMSRKVKGETYYFLWATNFMNENFII